MAYGDFKDLAKRTVAEKVLRDKAYKIASDQKYDGYPRGLASMVYKFFNKTLTVVVLLIIIMIKKIYNQLTNFINQLLENLEK